MTTFYFGLNINRSLAEIADKNQSLKNINLDIRDLDKIRNISGSGVTKTDLQTLSGLNFDAEKVTYALETETSFYELLTANIYDKYSYVDANINLNGGLGAAAYKYNYVDFSANTIKKADVSTSRVSSWSTFDTPVNNSSPIFYGGNVTVEGAIEVSNLVITSAVSQRKYDAEIPTHRIKVNVAGTDTYLYAMKGIPLSFDGFFSVATVNATVTPLAGDIKPTWVIKETDPNSTVAPFEYINVLSLNNVSDINFRSGAAKNRTIEFYYPPDNIVAFNLANCNIIALPKIVLSNLTSFNISSNNLREFPNLSNFSKLNTIDVSFNNFTRTGNNVLQSFTPEVLNRLPSNTVYLKAGHTFGGQITANLETLKLTTLDLSCATTQDRFFVGTTPNVNSSTIQVYNMSINRFNAVSNTVLSSTSLKTINLNNNFLNQNNISFASNELETLDISLIVGAVNLVNVSSKNKLISYNMSAVNIDENNLSYPNNVKNIFNGCSSLQTIFLRNTNVRGNFPDLVGCNSLRYIDFLYTNIGSYNNDYVLSNNTFNSCRTSLQTLYWESPNISLRPIESGALKDMFNLREFFICSRRQGLNGNIPVNLFDDCKSLRAVWLHVNNLSGSVPTFNNNNNLVLLYAPVNNFSGEVPNINKRNFRYLYLHYNNLSEFNKLDSSSFWVIHLGNNQLTSIPDLSNLVNLRELYLNNNSISIYTAGAFAKMTLIRLINLNGNNLTQGAVDQIIRDLNTNYNSAPRRGVTVNIRGTNNSAPSNNKEIRDILTKLSVSGWNITVN